MNTIFWLSIAGAAIGWFSTVYVVVDYCLSNEFERIVYRYVKWPFPFAVICTIVAITIWG